MQFDLIRFDEVRRVFNIYSILWETRERLMTSFKYLCLHYEYALQYCALDFKKLLSYHILYVVIIVVVF